MADVIGLINDVISLFTFLSSLIPAPDVQTTVVRVAAGLNGNGLSGADGSINEVRTFDTNQALIGRSTGGYASSGGFVDLAAHQTGQQQAVFAQIYASNDAICIPYVSTTWVDNSQYAWVGDFGYVCGLEWYYSAVFVDGGSYAPRCTWIDGDDTNGINDGMIMIRFPSFTSDNQNSDPNSYCGDPAFRAYTTDGGSIFKRDDTTTTRKLDSRLVISQIPTHNATELCASKTSRGPDLVSVSEGVYCNMETREIMPICDSATKTGCFQVGSSSEFHSLVDTDGNAKNQSYTEVLEWNVPDSSK